MGSTRDVTLRILGESKGAQGALADVDKSAGTTAGHIESMGGKFQAAGQVMHSSMSPLLGVFGPMADGFEKLKLGSDHVKESWSGMSSGVEKAGATLVGAGAAVTGVGLLLTEVGHKQEQAHVALEQAIKNTGGSYDDEAASIKQTITHMETFGHSAADTQEALTHGVEALGSYKAANDVMGAAVELAARSHISLTAAMDQIIKGAGGAGKALKSLSINVADVIDKQKSLTAATSAHDTAVAALNALVEKQGNAAETAAAKAETASASAASAVKQHRDAVAALETATKDFQTLAAGPTADAVVAADIKEAQAIKGTRDATQAVIDTKKALYDLEHPDTSTSQENEVKASLSQEKATLALTDAQVALVAAQATGDPRKIEDATIAEKEAELALTDAKKASAAATAATAQMMADSLPGSDAHRKATNAESDAELNLQQAQQTQADATKAQKQMYLDALPGSKAYEDEQRKVADATDTLASTQRAEAQANQQAVAASQAARAEAEALAKAKAKVAETATSLTHATDANASASNALAVATAVLSKTHGIAEAQANTFGGKILALKTHFLDVAGTIGAKFGPMMVQTGPLLMGLGAIMESGLVPKVVSLGLEIVGTGIMWVTTHASMLAATISTMIGIDISTGGLLLILAAIIAGVLLVWKNWDTIWTFVKEAFSVTVDWIKGHVELLLAIFLPFLLPIYEIAKHWGEIWDWVSTKFSDIWQGIKDAASGIGSFFAGIWDGMIGGVKWGINAAIDLINQAITFMDSVQVKIPSWVPLIGGNQFGLDIPLIPKLAAGGTAIGAGLALVGEKGPEMLNLPTGASVIPLNRGGSGGDSLHFAPGSIIVNGAQDPTATAKAVMVEINRYKARNGRTAWT